MMLTVTSLCLGYGPQDVLRDVSLSLQEGEFVGLIGPNGSGKSTLLRALAGILRPRTGTIFVDGKDLSHCNRKGIARTIAYLPQDRHIPFSYSARNLVLAGRYARLSWYEQESDSDRQRAELCLSLVGGQSFADTPATELSGGQRQRALLARTFMQGGKVYLLDEPTAELDPIFEKRVFVLLRQLAGKGRIVVTALHDLNLAARYCSRLILLGDHRVVADGRAEAVLSDGPVSRAYGTACHVLHRGEGIVLSEADEAALERERNIVLDRILR
jgi:ABC-type cobalamin/Fe3+-siderophores transport system ATPase subunit